MLHESCMHVLWDHETHPRQQGLHLKVWLASEMIPCLVWLGFEYLGTELLPSLGKECRCMARSCWRKSLLNQD